MRERLRIIAENHWLKLKLTYYQTPDLVKIERTPVEDAIRKQLVQNGEDLWWDNTNSRISEKYNLDWSTLRKWLKDYPNW